MAPKKQVNNITIESNKTIEQKYQSMTQEQHILLRPDTYVGDIQPQTESMFIYDDIKNKIVKKNITYVPGLYKIFDEIIVNARDQTEVDKTCDTIMVSINKETGEISVYNNGRGIDIEIHAEHNIYVPELIFGKLLTSTNYDDTEARTTGGRNGYGAKLTNLFSKRFVVEVGDISRKRKFQQIFSENMTKRSEAKISELKTKNGYTKITFIPDFEKFKLTSLTDDIISLFKKRVYDLAGVTTRCKIYYNDNRINCNTFENFIKLYHFNGMKEEVENNEDDQNEEKQNEEKEYEDQIENDESYKLFFEKVNENWELGLMYAPDIGVTEQVSFVNGICTYHGGSHVNYITDIVINSLKDMVLKKHKDIVIKPNQIKENLIVFIKSTIVNPSFTSQTKETLKTKISDFGTKCEINTKTLNKFSKSGILNQVITLIKLKEQAILKKTDGKKVANLRGIPKLEDANKAGSKESHKCKLILTEGDSAKALAMSGRSITGSDYYGVFPLKGKLLNVREATAKQLLENEEIINIKKIMGLQHEKEYNDLSTLRYGGIIAMCDQDSVTGDTPLLLKNEKNEIEVINIENLCDKWSYNKETLDYDNLQILSLKQYGNINNYKVWTDNGWTDIKHVMRHKVNKRIFRILTHTGCVDVTEDHSLLDINGNIISPKDCKVDNYLLHNNYYFERNKYNIPNDIDTYNFHELHKIASKLNIQKYQEFKKNDLLDIIKTFNNKTYIQELNNDYGITLDEAYVMGLFFADGSCKIYDWEYTYHNKNRPKAYTYNRTSYNWAISNTNLPFLEKAKNILEKCYNYEFVIIKDRHNHENRGFKPSYKLQMNGCSKTVDIINKYRNLFYKKNDKCVPLEILNSNYDIRFSFFHGYYDGDGHKGSKWYDDQTKPSYECDKLMIDTFSKITAQSVYYLCRSIGYEVTINNNIKKPNVYTINLTKGKIQDKPERIKKIIDLGTTEQYVYDLETENHHFQAGVGSLIVHNTDGHHIKGLLLNFFHYFWPSLLKIPNFISSLSTPIIKATKGKEELIFYNVPDYEEWKKNGTKGWNIKYYKGLGTSTSKEAKEYFTDIDNKLINYLDDQTLIDQIFISNDNDDNDDNDKGVKHKDPCTESITLAFDKKRADDRKRWLLNYNRNTVLNNNQKKVPIGEFINKELIHFSNEDICRSIPSICDGLKPSQRKVLYGAFLKKINNKSNEVKVAQLSGFVSEKTCYHHGEASLNGTIINMAQNYVGSNNINLLFPSGQMGTRIMGGKDAASPRYIFTYLAELTRLIFKQEDEPILKYLDDDGTQIEPEYFMPIIPMILVNGTEGIGTGFSTKIPCYDPLIIIDNLLAMIEDKPVKKMIPWYKNFFGEISQVADKPNNFLLYGVYDKIDDEHIRITELPIGTWTTDYINFLDGLEAKGIIKGYIKNNTEELVDIVVEFDQDKLESWIENNSIYNRLNLVGKRSTTNMHLYSPQGTIKKYESPIEILEEFYNVRIDFYVKRKEYIINKLTKELNILDHKMRFIKDVLDKKIIIERKKKQEVINKLIELKYLPLEDDSYDYLIGMPLYSLTEEKIKELEDKCKNKEQELAKIRTTSEEDMWKTELTELKDKYIEWLNNNKIEVNKKNNKIGKIRSSSTIIVKSAIKPTIKKRTASAAPKKGKKQTI